MTAYQHPSKNLNHLCRPLDDFIHREDIENLNHHRHNDHETETTFGNSVPLHDFGRIVHFEQRDYGKGQLHELYKVQQTHDFVHVAKRDYQDAGDDRDGSVY